MLTKKGSKKTKYTLLHTYKDEGKKIQEYVSIANPANVQTIMEFNDVKKIAKNLYECLYGSITCYVMELNDRIFIRALCYKCADSVNNDIYVFGDGQDGYKTPIVLKITDDEACIVKYKKYGDNHFYCSNNILFLTDKQRVISIDIEIKHSREADTFFVIEGIRNGYRFTYLLTKQGVQIIKLPDEITYKTEFSMAAQGYYMLYTLAKEDYSLLFDKRTNKTVKIKDLLMTSMVKGDASNKYDQVVVYRTMDDSVMWMKSGENKPVEQPIKIDGNYYRFDSENNKIVPLKAKTITEQKKRLKDEAKSKPSKVLEKFVRDGIVFEITSTGLMCNGHYSGLTINKGMLRSGDGSTCNCGDVISYDAGRPVDVDYSYTIYDEDSKKTEHYLCEGDKRSVKVEVEDLFGYITTNEQVISSDMLIPCSDNVFAISRFNKAFSLNRIRDGVLQSNTSLLFPVLFQDTDFTVTIKDDLFQIISDVFGTGSIVVTGSLLKLTKEGLLLLNRDFRSAVLIKSNFEIIRKTLKEWVQSPYYELYDIEGWKNKYEDIPSLLYKTGKPLEDMKLF